MVESIVEEILSHRWRHRFLQSLGKTKVWSFGERFLRCWVELGRRANGGVS
jgi:hypothetical protein